MGEHDLAEKPTRTRLIVLGFLCAMAFILYLDRVCMSQAVKPIERDLGLSREKMTAIAIAFTLAYGLFEIPTGRMGDRIGSRRVLTRIVIWWSAFTMLTGVAWGFVSLLVVRFLFGAGEAGALPNAARVVSRWFPPLERGRVQGLIMACSLAGSTLSPWLAAVLIHHFGWRTVFFLFGSVGFVWAFAFFRWFRDNPGDHPKVNAAELEHIGGGAPAAAHGSLPWRQIGANRTIWLLSAIVVCNAFVMYVFFTWYPTYLQEARHESNLISGWLATLVQAGAATGTLIGGFVLDRLTKTARDPILARRLAAFGVEMFAALFIFLAVRNDSSQISALLFAASCFCICSQQSAWWSSAIEVSGPHVGALFGLMNGLGVIGAMSSQFFFGAFPVWRENLGYEGRLRWDPAFDVCAVVFLIAGLCWLFVNPRRRIGESSRAE